MATLFGAQDRLTQLLQQRREQRKKEQLALATAAAKSNPRQAGLLATGAAFGTGLGQGIAQGLFGESSAIEQARTLAQDEKADSQQVQDYLTNAAQDPEYAEQYYFKAAEIANKYDPKMAIELANKAVAARDKQTPIRTQRIFTAAEQEVRKEVDPTENPVEYNQLMADRLSQAGDPNVQALAKPYLDNLVSFGLANAKEKAKEKGVKYDSPEGTEVKSALSFLKVSGYESGLSSAEETAASVELASHAKDIMAENPGMKYNEALKFGIQRMKERGSIKENDGLFSFFSGNYEYASPLDASQSPVRETNINGKKVTIRRKGD